MPKKKKKFINNINYDNASWSFDGKTVKSFDKHIYNSIPFYESMHDVALKFSDFFLCENDIVPDLEISRSLCGLGFSACKFSGRLII